MIKVNVKVDHPEFSCDMTMSQTKALAFLKRIKATFVENIKVVTKVIGKDENKGK